ncbi:hypothetical protein D3I60_01485, partial [Brevibacterium permense]|nr:hypothetical protein [Brevibacterium permense]
MSKTREAAHKQSRDSSRESYPCLIAAARSQEGTLTAVQITFLDPQTGAKAAIATPKKSFGVIKGSAVTLQEGTDPDALFIAEGIETALSLKAAGLKGTIKACLGLSNMNHLVPDSELSPAETPYKHIVICVDHDPDDSPATKSLNKAVLT